MKSVVKDYNVNADIQALLCHMGIQATKHPTLL